MADKLKLVVAISGASGSLYARVFLDTLLQLKEQIETVGIVMSKNAKDVWQHELGDQAYKDLPFTFYDKQDFYAPFASGSARYQAMVIIPCSMGTLGRIATGISDDLTCRAADVMLKERRKLVLVCRDTPLNLIHIQNMERVTHAGGIICPATPSFYSQPKNFEELAKTVTDRVIDLIGLQIDSYRWGNS
jgi:4-hydroxy-3-polyprenylbenzoate decarboxylase